MKHLIILLFLIPVAFSGCDRKTDKKESPYLADLRECYGAATTKKIDSCSYVLVPFVGATRGFTITHSGNCPNKIHQKHP